MFYKELSDVGLLRSDLEPVVSVLLDGFNLVLERRAASLAFDLTPVSL